jgi:hypothetical protein
MWAHACDAIARLDPAPDKRLGELRDGGRELPEGEGRLRPVLTLPDRSICVPELSAHPPVYAVPGDVQPAADEPGRPLRATRDVHHLIPRLGELEADVLDHRGPEPPGLLLRPSHELPVILDPMPPHEPRHIGPLAHLFTRCPDHFAPSTWKSGSHSRRRGRYQFHLPSSFMVAGSTTDRMIVASISSEIATPKPIC